LREEARPCSTATPRCGSSPQRVERDRRHSLARGILLRYPTGVRGHDRPIPRGEGHINSITLRKPDAGALRGLVLSIPYEVSDLVRRSIFVRVEHQAAFAQVRDVETVVVMPRRDYFTRVV